MSLLRSFTLNLVTLLHYLDTWPDKAELFWEDFSSDSYCMEQFFSNPGNVIKLLKKVSLRQSFDVFKTIYLDIEKKNPIVLNRVIEDPKCFHSIVVYLIQSDDVGSFSLFIDYLKSKNQLNLIRDVVGYSNQSGCNIFHLAAQRSFCFGFYSLLNALRDDRGALSHFGRLDAHGNTPLYYFSYYCNDNKLLVDVMQLLCSTDVVELLSKTHQKVLLEYILANYFFLDDKLNSAYDYEFIMSRVKVKSLSMVISQLPTLVKQHNLVESRLSALFDMLDQLSNNQTSSMCDSITLRKEKKWYDWFSMFHRRSEKSAISGFELTSMKSSMGQAQASDPTSVTAFR
ncbi:MAG: hypothetical protein CL816_03705 [Coxiellaceae bacterium]|nr:hypothetical protein [Coxiellaceae bacterium]